MTDKKEDIEIEFEEEIIQEGSLEDKLKSLRNKLKECETEKKDYLDGWQRSKADGINAKKDWEEQRSSLIKIGSSNLIEDLLPTLDSFSMAFKNKEQWEKVDDTWRKGVEYIHQQLIESLQVHGLSEVNPGLGSEIEPTEQEVVGEIQSDQPSGSIAQIQRIGYKLEDRVIRPAEILISK